jgi:glycerophosphoryl diester phosphodiesterase
MLPTAFVKQAHIAGLQVHPYTFRKDALPNNTEQEQILNVLFKELKVDGVFTDFTDTVVNHLAQ